MGKTRLDGRGRGRLGWGLAGVALGLSAAACALFRPQVTFYAQLLRAYFKGRSFSNRYPHAAHDVAFAGPSGPRLDLYAPEEGTGHPVLIFVHGGGWKDYSKELFAPVAMLLVPRGIVVVTPDYTLYPGASYEQMADEVAAATAWTLENVDRYGGDPRKVVLAGHSAGGHLIGMVGLDAHFLAAHRHSPHELYGLAGLSGVYDIRSQYAFEASKGSDAQVMVTVMGGHAGFATASPVTHVQPGGPPWLLVHGEKDDVVPAGISRDFAAALAAAGVPHDLLIYPSGHSDYLFDALAKPDAAIIEDLLHFALRAR